MAHYMSMSDSQNRRMPDFREARCPSRVYEGSRDDGGCVVTVFDSALPQSDSNPRALSVAASQSIKDCCARFDWGRGDAGALQLAIALLHDVSGDADTALRWYEHFAKTYVRQLPATWAVPELDIALWLYCFQNARPGA